MKFIYINILLFHGFPWNSPAVPWNSMELFHGIPWNIKSSMELDTNTECHGIPWNPRTFKKKVPWNSMEFDKWHGTWLHHQIPWNSMESPNPSNKFQGIPGNYERFMKLEVKRNSMEFHRIFGAIPWNAGSVKYDITELHGIPGPLFTKKTPSYGYRDPHYIPKTVWRPSQVYNGNPYTDKTASS